MTHHDSCQLARPARRILACAAVLLAFVAGPAASLHAQTFVAEWAEADIGRIGPTGLAVDTIGATTYLYVADNNNGRIIKFNLNTGRREAVWGATGDKDGEFNSPFGIAVDPLSHDIYVVERVNNRVQRLTSNGVFVMKWGIGGVRDGEFWSPIGIAADASGNVYVSDSNNHRIQKFRIQATAGGWQAQHLASWGGEGSAPGKLNRPFGVTLAGNVLWVADSFNHRLQKFDTNGNFLGAVGSHGTGDGQFITPTWVNFDSTGAYYVAETNSDPQSPAAPDRAHQRIQKFDAAGTFLLKWGREGVNGGEFRLPFDVVIHDNHAYVSDYYNTRLQKFSLAGGPTVPPPPPPPPPTAQAAKFINLSSRLGTVDGDTSRAFIAGFVVSGSTPKPVLIRAIGPGLAQFGVAGALPNPRLQIYSGAQLVAENDDWTDTPAMRTLRERVGAFALTAGSRDAALIVTLAPGAYSAHVVASGGQGVGLVEVYDGESTQASCQLVNLSTRGFVDSGDAVLVAGFVVSGDVPKRVLIRGIGPALGGFGVTGALADSVLKVYSGSTLLAENDDWSTPQSTPGGPAVGSAAEISAAGGTAGAFALPGGSRDAALLVTLPPGSYSAVVSGAGNLTGAGLVEVYEIAR